MNIHSCMYACMYIFSMYLLSAYFSRHWTRIELMETVRKVIHNLATGNFWSKSNHQFQYNVFKKKRRRGGNWRNGEKRRAKRRGKKEKSSSRSCLTCCGGHTLWWQREGLEEGIYFLRIKPRNLYIQGMNSTTGDTFLTRNKIHWTGVTV